MVLLLCILFDEGFCDILLLNEVCFICNLSDKVSEVCDCTSTFRVSKILRGEELFSRGCVRNNGFCMVFAGQLFQHIALGANGVGGSVIVLCVSHALFL